MLKLHPIFLRLSGKALEQKVLSHNRMKCASIGSLFIAVCALLAPAQAQVLWSIDWESAPPIQWQTGIETSQPLSPPLSGTTTNVGAPHSNVLNVLVDASSQTQYWKAMWVLDMSPAPDIPYDPTHTFLKFDVLVSLRRPAHVQLVFSSGSDYRQLETDVYPTASNSFQTFVIPISSFAITSSTSPDLPHEPTFIEFGLEGDPSAPDSTWPSNTNNFIFVDNISYFHQPGLSIGKSNGLLSLCWPTNAFNFVLQQSAVPGVPSSWSAVTNSPAVVNGQLQINVPMTQGGLFYRLSGPTM